MFEGLVNGILFNYAFVVFTILIFIAAVGKKKRQKSMRVIAYIVIGICILYFVFLLWCIIGFGSNVPENAPVPISE